MAVDSATFKLHKAGTRGSGRDGGDRFDFAWKVRCSHPADSVATVLRWKGCPARGGRPPRSLGVPMNYRCVDVGVEPMGDSLHWYEVTAGYERRPLHPLDKWSIRGGGSTKTRTLYFDSDGTPYRNSAGDLLLPLPEWPKAGGEWQVTVRRITLANFSSRSWHTNASAIWGFAPETLLIGNISWQAGFEDGWSFWEISVPFTYDPDTHKDVLIDAGYNFVNGSTLKSIAGNAEGFEDAEPASPFLLDGAGGALAAGGTPVTGEFRPAPRTDVAAMALPDPFSLPPAG